MKDDNVVIEQLMSELERMQKRTDVLLESGHKQLLSIYEGLDECVYVADPDTHELLYMNKALRNLLGGGVKYIGKKCYKVLQGMDSPCPFCSNEFILGKNLGKTYIWDFQNKITKRNYHCIDRAINWLDGRTVRLELAIDITERKKAEQKLEILNKELWKTNRKLHKLMLKDPHTGLYNHRYFEEIIDAEFYRAKRYGQPLSVILLDIDYFKSINDMYGHHFGDIVLRQFAKKLRRLARLHDYVIRYGGEEFVVVLPGSDKEGAHRLAHRLANVIKTCKFGNLEDTVKLRLSIAVASYPNDNIFRSSDFIELADKTLNKAKDCGGNMVSSCSEVISKPYALNSEYDTSNIRYLRQKLDRLTKRSNQSLIESIFAFAKTIELKDHYTGEHVERTVYYATEIAKRFGYSSEGLLLIEQASMLHDLGKIGISEAILLKKGKLTEDEFEKIKEHPKIGADIIRPIQFLHNLIPLILYHHERWDGRGYPFGLKEKEIPLGARIIAIADVYQALISDRPYRKAFTGKKAVTIIRESSGSHFDPVIADVFMKVISN